MDSGEPRTLKVTGMLPEGSDKGFKGCTKNSPAERSLGGHMSCHRLAGMQSKSTPRPAVLGMVPPGPKMFSCPSCGREFQSKGALGGHRSRGHCHPNVAGQKAKKPEVSKILPGVALNATRRYYCKNCGEGFDTFQFLGWHKAKCNDVVQCGPEKYYCKYCG